jgi:GNAT superfamily N-acetyltransferase
VVEVRHEAADSALARRLLERYRGELAERFPGGFDLGRTVSAEPTELTPPAGVFCVLLVDGEPRGCGGVKLISPGAAELKRMWVDPAVRGRGAGRRLLAALETEASALGAEEVRLDTSAHLTEAIALYRSAGYEEIPAYNDNPYAAHWFRKALRRGSGSDRPPGGSGSAAGTPAGMP